MCLSAADQGMGRGEFRPCIGVKEECAEEGDLVCAKSTYYDVKGAPLKLRLKDTVPGKTLTILSPQGSMSQNVCFSRSLLHLSLFPPSWIIEGRHLLLLEIKLRPRVWKYLAEAQPAFVWSEVYGRKSAAQELKAGITPIK